MVSVQKKKIYFMAGRPQPHKIHKNYADSIGAKLIFEDEFIKWHHLKSPNKLIKYLSILINAFAILFRPGTIYVSECVRMPLLIGKYIAFFRNITIINLAADESPILYCSKQYNFLSRIAHLYFWKKADANICIGPCQAQLLREILAKSPTSKIYEIRNGLSENMFENLQYVTKCKSNYKLILIANVDSDWRIKYKGIDLAIKSFIKASHLIPGLQLYIYGKVCPIVKEKLVSDFLPGPLGENIIFNGEFNDLFLVLKDKWLNMQLGYGDAFPTTTIETAAAGIPSIVAKTCGTYVIMENVDKKFVVDPDEEQVVNAIYYYYNFTNSQQCKLSDIVRKEAINYKEETCIKHFQEIISCVISKNEYD